MTATLTERRTMATAGCRFPDWCEGSCALGGHIGGECNHWSDYRVFHADDTFDRVAIQLYGYENDSDGIDPVRVYLAFGGRFDEEDGIGFVPAVIRGCGVALRDFVKPGGEHDKVIHSSLDTDGLAMTAEFRYERDRRDGGFLAEHVEFSVMGTHGHWLRIRLDLADSRRFGIALLEAADQAGASNRRFGLVTK